MKTYVTHGLKWKMSQKWMRWSDVQTPPPPPCMCFRPPPLPPLNPTWEKQFFVDLCISSNFRQLWFRWQESPSLPHQPNRGVGGKNFEWIYAYHQISCNFGSDCRKAPPPPTPHRPNRENFFETGVSNMETFAMVVLGRECISSNFLQLWFRLHKSPHPQSAKHGKPIWNWSL